MSFTQTYTNSFKQQVLQGTQDLVNDDLYIALYTDSATLGVSTTAYSTTNEVSGTGYTAGGKPLQNATINISEGIVYIDFDDVAWAGASFTARGALIYNTSQSNSSVAVLDFGANQTCVNQTFTVRMPSNTATTAIFRFT